MSGEKLDQDEQMFIHLISSFSSTAWIGLGKIKNPVTDKIERDLKQASYAIDMLDMLSRRMGDNLSDAEKRFLNSTIGDLKINYVDEVKKSEEAKDKADAEKVDEEEKDSLETGAVSDLENDDENGKKKTDENTEDK
ncbi:MAG: DUF1844 domain-containing protein [Candidatus Marinimicrobia bacterium]|nr:DUF1844 domain-containing protein [Candidatus Neomarinimicrobiota bacterium]